MCVFFFLIDAPLVRAFRNVACAFCIHAYSFIQCEYKRFYHGVSSLHRNSFRFAFIRLVFRSIWLAAIHRFISLRFSRVCQRRCRFFFVPSLSVTDIPESLSENIARIWCIFECLRYLSSLIAAVSWLVTHVLCIYGNALRFVLLFCDSVTFFVIAIVKL